MVLKIEVFEDDGVWGENPRFVDKPCEKDDVVTIKIKDEEIYASGSEIAQVVRIVRKYLKQWNAYKYYRDHVDQFVEDCFNVKLTSYQKEALNQMKSSRNRTW